MSLSIVPHNDDWKQKFDRESAKILHALGPNVRTVHHIGSTVIPNILAKPIIDILIEVSGIDKVDDHSDQMEAFGFESLGEYGIDGRRYFRRNDSSGRRAFHVHVFESGSPHILRHIAFRDFLLAHPVKAQEYSDLKQLLVTDGVAASDEYQALKAPFIEGCIADAVRWLDKT